MYLTPDRKSLQTKNIFPFLRLITKLVLFELHKFFNTQAKLGDILYTHTRINFAVSNYLNNSFKNVYGTFSSMSCCPCFSRLERLNQWHTFDIPRLLLLYDNAYTLSRRKPLQKFFYSTNLKVNTIKNSENSQPISTISWKKDNWEFLIDYCADIFGKRTGSN